MVFLSSLFTPKFEQFILAAQRAKPYDQLIREGGDITSVGRRYTKGTTKEDLHRNIWKAFERAVNGAFSARKQSHIRARYNFNQKALKRGNHPLEPRYIEYYGVGAANVYTHHLEECLPWYKRDLRSRSVAEIRQAYVDATRYSYLGQRQDPREIYGAPRTMPEQFVKDLFRMDQQRCNLYEGVCDLISKDPRIPALHPYYSRLTMAIISLLETHKCTIGGKIDDRRDLNMVIPAPMRAGGEEDYYKVHDIISFGGLTAVALVPLSDKSSLQPLLTFRCTKQAPSQTDAIPSFLNDLQTKLGESGYEHSKEELRRLMKDPQFTKGKKIKVCAYSLGGAHAAYFMEDAEHWKQVDEFIGFNFTGNDKAVIESLARQINDLPEEEIPPSFYIHRNVSNEEATLGDWVNKVGDKHMGWGITHPNGIVQVYEWVIDDYPAPPNFFSWKNLLVSMNLHAVRPLDSKRRYRYNFYSGPTQCNPVLEVRDGTVEQIRMEWGRKVHIPIGAIASFLEFLFRVFGLKFLEDLVKKNTR